MPYTLTLSKTLRKAGWQVKIYDAEGPEEPHVSIFRKGRKWRKSLRTGEFLDEGDRSSQIDDNVRAAIERNWETLQKEWVKIHGKVNPISSKGGTKGGDES
jgi:hypothetical protein